MKPNLREGSSLLFPQLTPVQKRIQIFVFVFLALTLLIDEVNGQCTTPNPDIESTSNNWTLFSIDETVNTDEFGIMKYEPHGTAGSKMIVFGGLVKVHTNGGNLVNVIPNTPFDGTEDFSGAGEFIPLDPGDHLILFKMEADDRLGFLNINVDLTRIKVTQFGLQANGDSDGILAGDCASLSNTLPVEISQFTAREYTDNVLLQWTTETEENNRGFELQKSVGGKYFQTKVFIPGQGDSDKAHAYYYIDNNLTQNITYYYRLKSIDYDGATYLSKVISAEIKNSHGGTISPVYPNPVLASNAGLQIIAGKDTDIKIALFNAYGKLIFRDNKLMNKGTNTLEYNMSNLSAGSYYFLLEMNGQQFTRKVYVMRG